MRKNTEAVYEAWKSGTSKKFNAISTDGQTILSYSTPILRHGNPVLFNSKKYSSTTTRQQNDLRVLLTHDDVSFTEQEVI